MKTIDIRRSVRKFTDQSVEPAKIEAMLRAGMQAPSAGNQRPWEFVVVTEASTREAISQMSPYAGAAKDAPLIIVVLASDQRMRFPENMQQDLGACTQNILLEAVEQDLGTTWMSVYPQEARIECLREAITLPEGVTPYNIIIVGYPEVEGANKYVDRFEEDRIHYEKY